MSAPNRSRKRPHPAGAARRLAGWLSVAAMFGLTGGMAVASRLPTSTASTTAQSSTSSAGTTSSDDTSSASRAATTNAVAGTASSQSVTVSRAS